MATEEEANESLVKNALGNNEGARIGAKTVINSKTDAKQNVDSDEAPSLSLSVPEASIVGPTMNDDENCLGDNQYFFEDEVFIIDKTGRVKFGLIIETCDSYSGDEDEDDDEEKLNRGDVRVAWYPHGREHVRSENSIGLADRTLMPGDVVRRLTVGSNPQRGYVRDIKISADVKVIGLPYVIKNVAAERLRPLSVWQRDCTVCLDSWVGSAKDVDEKAVLKGVNGVRFEIHSSDFYHFKELNTSRRPSVFSPLIFFPGNIVVGRLPLTEKATILTPDIPLPLNRKGAMLKGKFVVESVRTEGVFVQWQCKAFSKGSSKKISELEPPKPYVTSDQLSRVKRLNVFESCVLQIADRSYLTFEPNDKLVWKSKWEKETANRFKEIFEQKQKLEGGKKQKLPKNTKSSTKMSKSPATENSTVKEYTTKKKEKPIAEKEQSNSTDNEWVDTTTSASTDTSDASEGESEYLSVEDVTLDQSDKDSNYKTDNENSVENDNVNGNGNGAGASTKKSITRNVAKKSFPIRNKTSMHAKVSGNTPKWQNKNFFNIPLTNKGSVPEGTELIAETMLVYSTVSVVWQDGTVEHDIPSTELYPIHHLDNHEFFPGDFVMLSREDLNITFRDYGVIQTVDHQGRIAKVKWFKTYTSEDDPNFSPIYKGESEVSVYDLKDHPDFTYRPGGMVIRVSNFIGDDAVCTAGQVLDNGIDGRVKVAWVDGHISNCYPQDLFDVGHHEQNDYVVDSDSWETQSENSGLAADEEEQENENPELVCAESDIAVNVERTLNAIARLEDILKASPQLQTRNVMRKLLSIYKTGRYIDRLMHTSFFHEEVFLTLIGRIIEEEPSLRGTENVFLAYANAKITPEDLYKVLKSILSVPNNVSDENASQENNLAAAEKPEEKLNSEESHLSNSPKVVSTVGSRIAGSANNMSGSGGSKGSNSGTATTPVRHLRNCTYTTHILHVRSNANYASTCGSDAPKSLYSVLPASELEKLVEEDKQQNKDNTAISPTHQPSGSGQTDSHSAEKNHLLSSALLSIEKAYQVTHSIKTNVEVLLSQDDSGTFSRNNSDASSNNAVENDIILEESNAADSGGGTITKVVSKKRKASTEFDVISQIELSDILPSEKLCVPLCEMLKQQLQKCKNEIDRQSSRFTSYKSLAVPNNTDGHQSIIDTDNMVIVTSTDEEAQTQCQTDSTQDTECKDFAIKTDKPNELATENWVVPDECFKILSNAPKNHKFYTSTCEPSQPQLYFRAVQREHRLLKSSLPKGIWLRFYEDRIDLLSVMMEGPKKTPYENGLYFFDIQLDQDYPKRPPVCHYISYCVDRLNPNLYEEGKVCVSLLGTWSGRDVEVWGPNSTLLQVLVSIQGLILVPEPYFNEAGYEKQKGSQQGLENSRMYNEMVVIKVAQSTMKMLSNPPAIFLDEILEYYKQYGVQMYERISGWVELSKRPSMETENLEFVKPDFPLLPASRGFCLTLDGLLRSFKEKIESFLSKSGGENEPKIIESLNPKMPADCGVVDDSKEESNKS